MVKIKVKHEKAMHSIDVDPGDGLECIKAVVMSVTMVPCDKQKLIVKGKEVKEGDDLAKIFKPGAAVLLQGSAEAYAEGVPKDLICEFARESVDAPLGFSCKDEREGVDGAFTVLAAVVDGSAADGAGLKRFVSRPLRRVNGLPVANAAAVAAAARGAAAVTLIFDQRWAGGGKVDAVLEETPPGLINLGNTCYLNSCVQTLRMVPGFCTKVDECREQPPGPGMLMGMGGGGGLSDGAVVACLKQTYSQMKGSTDGDPVKPAMFVAAIKHRWPEFAATSPQGAPMQQDAEEFATKLMEGCQGAAGAVDPFFTGRTLTTRTCAETDAELPATEEKTFRMLTANLDSETSTLEHGIKLAMGGTVEMRSQVLERDATWKQDVCLSHMPEFMWVQLNRFAFRRDTQNRAKKLRKVQFPFRLDLYPFCTAALKKDRLDKRREELSEERDKLQEKKRAEKQAKGAKGPAAGAAAPMDVDKELEEGGIKKPKEGEKEGEAKGAGEKKEGAEKGEKKEGGEGGEKKEGEKHADAMDVDGAAAGGGAEPGAAAAAGGNDSGYYELCGVITHAGRTADSGHYKAFVKRDGEWWCHDDEKSYRTNEDKVRELYGGGEADSAYLLLYRSQDEKGTPAGIW